MNDRTGLASVAKAHVCDSYWTDQRQMGSHEKG